MVKMLFIVLLNVFQKKCMQDFMFSKKHKKTSSPFTPPNQRSELNPEIALFFGELPFFWPKLSFFWPSRSLWEQFSASKIGCIFVDVGWNRHNYLVELVIYLKKLICNKHLKLRHLGDGLEGNLSQNLADFETNCFYFRNIP